MKSQIVKSAGVIGALTGLSRVLGFVRDLVIATAFGTGLGAEAFVVSFKIPNLLRDLVGEGAANAAFVPVLTECREKRKDF
jgi:putative peptidoglycan lipid II flippase